VGADKSWFLKSKIKNALVISEIIEEDIHAINFSTIIQESIKSKDFRKAIRYFYLLSLKELADIKLINWQQGKTNESYIKEIKSSLLKSQFSKNTYLYEWIWYGNFLVDETLFNEASHSFQSFFEQIKKLKK